MLLHSLCHSRWQTASNELLGRVTAHPPHNLCPWPEFGTLPSTNSSQRADWLACTTLHGWGVVHLPIETSQSRCQSPGALAARICVFLSHQLSCLHRFYLLVRSVVHHQHHLSEQFGQFVALLPELTGEKPRIVAPGSSYSILHTCIAELGRKAVAERPNKAPRGKLASTAGAGVRARARESRVTESWRKGFRRPIGGMSTT
jgi:hypothetical protein